MFILKVLFNQINFMEQNKINKSNSLKIQEQNDISSRYLMG